MIEFDPSSYVEAYRKRNDRESKEIEKRLEEALVEASDIARLIKQTDSDIKQIFLFGSVAKGDPKFIDFDIDLALEGGDLYKALDIAEKSKFKIDLVQLNLLPEGIRNLIQKYGKPLL